VLDELRRLGRADQITATSRLSGGPQADVWLITYADGTQVVGKTITDAATGRRAPQHHREPARLAPRRLPGTSPPGQHLDRQRA